MRQVKEEKKKIHYHHVKVPVVMQMEYVECGAASLCMILAYYGKYVPLEQVRKDCNISRACDHSLEYVPFRSPSWLWERQGLLK